MVLPDLAIEVTPLTASAGGQGMTESAVVEPVALPAVPPLTRDSVTPSEISSQQDHEYKAIFDTFAADPLRGAALLSPKAERKKTSTVMLKKWLKVDTRGQVTMVKVDKHALVNGLGLQARDLRLLEPQVSGGYTSAILTREKALVVTLESVKCVCTPDFVLVFNPSDKLVIPFVEMLVKVLKPLHGPLPAVKPPPPKQGLKPSGSAPQLHHTLERDSTGSLGADSTASANILLQHQQQLAPQPSGCVGSTGPPSESDGEQSTLEQAVVRGTEMEAADTTPFELKALETVLDYVSNNLEMTAADLEAAAHPALDVLTKNITTGNLERVRRIKARLARLTTKVETIREILEGLLDDDSDLRDMNLTAKRERERLEKERELAVERALSGQHAATPPVVRTGKTIPELRTHSDKHEEEYEEEDDPVDEVEMVLEPYFMRLDNTFNKLHSLTEYIDDTEDYINIDLDSKRNQLIKVDLFMTSFTFCMGFIAAVTAILGMNLRNGHLLGLPTSYWAFVTASSTVSLLAAIFLILFTMYLKYKKILAA